MPGTTLRCFSLRERCREGRSSIVPCSTLRALKVNTTFTCGCRIRGLIRPPRPIRSQLAPRGFRSSASNSGSGFRRAVDPFACCASAVLSGQRPTDGQSRHWRLKSRGHVRNKAWHAERTAHARRKLIQFPTRRFALRLFSLQTNSISSVSGISRCCSVNANGRVNVPGSSTFT